ncbi:hypothetical protein HK100_008963, partial [Physocladia obscura]
MPTTFPVDTNLDREGLKHEHWVPYSLIFSVDRHFPLPDGSFPVHVLCKNFTSIRLVFSVEPDAAEFFTNIQKLINTPAIEQMYAFSYTPKTEAEVREKEYGWKIYDPEAEFKRMGMGSTNDAWRVTTINKDFS